MNALFEIKNVSFFCEKMSVFVSFFKSVKSA